MSLNRRTLLLGLVVLVVGAGVIGASGAFSSVQAERTVSLQTAGDSSALLKMVPHDSTIASTASESDTNSPVLQVSNSKINANARTEFASAFSIENNGDDNIDEFYIADNGSALGPDGAVDFIIADPPTAASPSVSVGDSVVGSSNAISLGAGGGNVTLSVVVDTTGSNQADLLNGGTVTLVANDTSATGVS